MKRSFKNFDSLKAHILSRSKIAILQAQEEVYKIIDGFLKQYYAEFTPEVYQRTEQLLYSLVKSEVSSTGNGWIAYVYFDFDLLDYSIKTFKDSFKLYPNTYKRNDWTHGNDIAIASNAMEGFDPHGFYRHGGKNTAIWTESMMILAKEKHNILKEKLLNAGIPISKK